MLPFFRRRTGRNAAPKPDKPAPSGRDDISVARSAIGSGNLRHAVAHLAGVIALDASDAGALALLDEVYSRSRDPLSLAPLEDRTFAGIAAAHALFLYRSGDTPEAFSVLFQAALAQPKAGFLRWAVDWLRNADRPAILPADLAKWFLSRLAERLPALSGIARDRDWIIAPDLLVAIEETQPGDTLRSFMSVALLRRLNRTADALEIARHAYGALPDYYSANAMASALRHAGQTEEAISMYERALALRPDESSVMLDIGDMFSECAKMEDAAIWYGRVVERVPDHPWAIPSLAAARYLATGDRAWLTQLQDYAVSHPDNERAKLLASQFEPYFGSYLPEPADPVINAMRDLTGRIDRKKPGPLNINIGLSSLEAPSALLAANMELLRHTAEGAVGLTVDDVPQPDPREPRSPVDLRLWQYDGVYAGPAVPAPMDEVRQLVAALAEHPYSYDTWLGLSRECARLLSPDQAGEIAASMVHPPAAPADMRAWVWLQRVQLAAALILASLEGPGVVARGEGVLLDILNGPVDWITGAAALGLAAVAREHPETTSVIVAAYKNAIAKAPATGFAACIAPVICSCREMPGISLEEREGLDALLSQIAVTVAAPAIPDVDDEPGYAPGDE